MNMTREYFKRIDYLTMSLTVNKVPYLVEDLYDGYKVTFPWCCGDVIAHSYMLGKNGWNVESFGFPWDEESVTVLTVADAINKITELYLERV